MFGNLFLALGFLSFFTCNCVAQVVQIFKGSADIRGGVLEAVHPGYLWLYADGTFGFMTDAWAQDE